MQQNSCKSYDLFTNTLTNCALSVKVHANALPDASPEKVAAIDDHFSEIDAEPRKLAYIHIFL